MTTLPVLIVAIVFGSISLWRFLGIRHKERMAEIEQRKQHALPPGKGAAGGTPEDQQTIEELRARVEHLETIVCSVDFELNAKLNRLATRQLEIGNAATKALAAGGGEAMSAKFTPRAKAFVLEPGQTLAKRFRIEQALGQGGMGAVYLAHDEQLHEQVALKIMHGLALLDPAAEDRLRREASAARRISHVNVVKIHDVGQDEGHLFLSMEYVEGQSLSALIGRYGPLPLARARKILAQLCKGLAAAHEQGVVHRDLKPGNVIVANDQRVKIIDFGLARLANLEGMTATGMLMGTPEYMAPEQVKGEAVDARTDLYALGALAYHVLTGRPPFTGETPIAVSLAQATNEPTPPSQLRPELSEAWDGFVLQALSKAPEQRFGSAQEMAEAIPS
ncbi:serine/threonine-protein kinase [Plesiocystis pacifica]|uniref:serine/threonine-protein kinase n=1 Tax=Plesiocystis pacifica TaxID=191768 RepID=UPI000A30C6D0|nr:serine/threonine-protein kinase [Plesiocystis pacifica]